jgi:uncharacterized protein DUF1496
MPMIRRFTRRASKAAKPSPPKLRGSGAAAKRTARDAGSRSTSCWYDGREYSEGAVIEMPPGSGQRKTCRSAPAGGRWE